MLTEETVPINDDRIEVTLMRGSQADPSEVRDVLNKAMELKGLNEHEVAVLMTIRNPGLLEELFHTARQVKEDPAAAECNWRVCQLLIAKAW